MDFGIVNDLLEINRDFRNFIKSINDSMKTQRIIKSDYDKVMSDDELNDHIMLKNIGQFLSLCLSFSLKRSFEIHFQVVYTSITFRVTLVGDVTGDAFSCFGTYCDTVLIESEFSNRSVIERFMCCCSR